MLTRAITLTELLISTIIIGIIMIGVVSSDYAVRKNSQNQNAGTLLTLNTRVLVNAIINNASLMSGYKNDQGYSSTTANSFCIRQDYNYSVSPPVPNNSPVDYSDDYWACYTFSSNSLYTCIKPPGAISASSCSAGDQGYKSLGGTVGIPSSSFGFDVASDVFSVIIVNRADPSQPKSISNPEVTVSAQTSPSGQSI